MRKYEFRRTITPHSLEPRVDVLSNNRIVISYNPDGKDGDPFYKFEEFDKDWNELGEAIKEMCNKKLFI